MQFKRLFTHGSSDPYSLIHFRQPEAMGDVQDVPLEHPDNWGSSSVELLAEAAHSNLPSPKKPIEENTIPSWLWQRSRSKPVGDRETSVRHILDRVVGAAVYRGWKHNIFSDEVSARNFFDEARYVLAQRFAGFEPGYLAAIGLDWAYGMDVKNPKTKAQPQPSNITPISNSMIDVVVSGRRDRTTISKWEKVIGLRAKAGTVPLHFSDTEAQWEKPVDAAVAATINLMTLRHNDGSVNIEALRHIVRICVMLVDLNHSAIPQLKIGFCNLGPLLMALALPYDSEAARATAAAISAIMTAEAYSVSAELAGLLGVAPEFSDNREICMRALRNHRRAAYGERNDYEKISITPSPLSVDACPDLALTATARNLWDQAIHLVHEHGLRMTQVTGFSSSPSLTLFMESESEGIKPLRSLARSDAENQSERGVHPSVVEALVRLGYDSKKQQSFTRHVVGAGSLEKSPSINFASLRARGFTPDVLGKVESAIPQARHLRHVFTPWVLGPEFCRKVLKIPAAKTNDVRFNLLAHLGFSNAQINAATSWVYGQNKVDASDLLRANHMNIFATAATVQPESYVRMAASVQGLISGDTSLQIRLPVGVAAERLEKLVLDAWRRGVKALAVTFDSAIELEKMAPSLKITRHKNAPTAFLHTKTPQLPKRQSRSALSRFGVARHGKAKTKGFSKTH